MAIQPTRPEAIDTGTLQSYADIFGHASEWRTEDGERFMAWTTPLVNCGGNGSYIRVADAETLRRPGGVFEEEPLERCAHHEMGSAVLAYMEGERSKHASS